MITIIIFLFNSVCVMYILCLFFGLYLSMFGTILHFGVCWHKLHHRILYLG